MTAADVRHQAIETMHGLMNYNFDECDHGKYSGGPSNGEPYAMCERFVDALLAAGVIRETDNTGNDVTVDYLCIGHPAWPDPLHVQTPDRARAWYDEHVASKPDIHISKRTVIREDFIPVARSSGVADTVNESSRPVPDKDTKPDTKDTKK